MVILQPITYEKWFCNVCKENPESYRWEMRTDLSNTKFKKVKGTNIDDYIALVCPNCGHPEVYVSIEAIKP